MQYANENTPVVSEILSGNAYCQDTVLTSLLSEINAVSNDRAIALPSPFDVQLTQSCCHALALHLTYLLHGKGGIKVNIVALVDYVTVHSFVEITTPDNTVVYMDGTGLYTSMNAIIARYTDDKPLSVRYISGEDAVSGNASAFLDLVDSLPITQFTYDIANMYIDNSGEELLNDILNAVIYTGLTRTAKGVTKQ